MKSLFELIKNLLESLFDSSAPSDKTITKTDDETSNPKSNTVSKHCIDIIKYYEAFKADAYLDPVGIVTIGYGDTGPHVKMGQKISETEASRRLHDRVEREFLPGVLSALTNQPKQSHLDAMVSLAYNIGISAFRKSTLVRLYNEGDVEKAGKEFQKWNRAGGKVLLGLRRRRLTEYERYKGKSAKESIRIGASLA